MKQEGMEYYSWEQFEKDVEIIAKKIGKKGWKFKNVYGLPRGGLILGICLSHRLEIPLILNSENIENYTLVVDDIADTGKTLYPYVSRVEVIVTLFYHRQSIVVPNIWLHEKKEKWIHFPWEA